MAITIGDMLGGIGAAFGGTGQQYAQGLRQREQGITEQKRAELQARQQAMYQDADTALKFLANPELTYEQRADNIIRLAEDRLDALSTYPDADPSDTLQVLELARQVRDGTDPFAVRKLSQILVPAASIYRQRFAPEQERGVVVNGNVVNPSTGEIIYKSPVDSQETENFGLTPQLFTDAEGNIRIGQPRSSGGIQIVDLPEGITPMLPASQRAFDPSAIAQQGAARTLAEVANIEATTDPTAARAGAVTTAEQEAEIATLVDRAVAEKDATRVAEQGARNRARQTKQDQLGLLSDLVGVAKEQSTGWTTGFVGSQLSKVPGTPAYDLGRTLDTLLASAGFETLAEMRANSPTGGALGNVTERELALLQATWGSLQQAQSKEQFEANLDRFNRQLQQSWDRVDRAYQQDYGVPYFQDGQQPMSPQINDDPLGIFQTGAQ